MKIIGIVFLALEKQILPTGPGVVAEVVEPAPMHTTITHAFLQG